MIITISGTPGTGKTSLARILKEKLGYTVLNVKKAITDNKLYDSYDTSNKCYVVDPKKLNRFLISQIKEHPDLIIDSLLSHYLPSKHVDLCVITKCNLKELEARLKKRRYTKQKIRDNLDSEIFDTCHVEAQEQGHKIFLVDTTKGIKKKAISDLLGAIT